MKRISTLLLVLFCIILLSSCENVLNQRPLTQISDEDVWQNPELIRAYVSDIYARLDHNQWNTGNHPDRWTELAAFNIGGTPGGPTSEMSRTNDVGGYWAYDLVRTVNVLLDELPDAMISDAERSQIEGEALAMRAYLYYKMQKRYGGVPLVDVVINPLEEIPQEYTERATEEAIADFIDSDLERAIELLSDDPNPPGRFNKWSANALKARANLWSASIAKYAEVQLNGLVGIPSNRADEFFTWASAAANAVITSGHYSLYDKEEDEATNFMRLFQDQENPEVIFRRSYNTTNVQHNWQEWMAPPSWAGRGSRQIPTLDYLLTFENIDGSDQQPQFGPDHLYENSWDPFANKDPRLRGSVFFDGESFLDGYYTVDTYEGVDTSATTPDPDDIYSTFGESYEDIPNVVGEDSRTYPVDDYSTTTGFIFKKYILTEYEEQDPQIGANDFWVFRLAEMYLIRAEAEFELGNPDPAAEALNETRERAGISLVDETTITMDHIRTERVAELTLEAGFRWWDLRRWRLADEVLNGRTVQGLRIIKHYESGQYYFLPIDAEPFTREFQEAHFYNPITNQRLDSNPDLVENPNY